MRVLILGRKDNFTRIIFNKFLELDKEVYLITEDPPLKLEFFKKRIKKYGILKVSGQILFFIIIIPILKLKSKKRIEDILKRNNYLLSDEKIRINKNYFHFKNINFDEVRKKILEINPDVIVVNGTRIIKNNILSCKENILFINMHSGITPKYRGVHGGYWALVNSDYENCGVTIHQVDLGIDTGNILSQKRIKITKEDTLLTYPYLQFELGLKEEIKILDKIEKKKTIERKNNKLESKLYSHPTLAEYLYNFFIKKVK